MDVVGDRLAGCDPLAHGLPVGGRHRGHAGAGVADRAGGMERGSRDDRADCGLRVGVLHAQAADVFEELGGGGVDDDLGEAGVVGALGGVEQAGDARRLDHPLADRAEHRGRVAGRARMPS